MTERASLEPEAASAAGAGPGIPATAGTRPAFLPSEVDPTVFDEAFLRQLERLLLIMRSPVRGGLKGGRRSVKRGQSVEFADYREYTLGDDLRQLDWNVYARLERLFVKLFVEEEDVTVTLLVDASASMAAGHPSKLLFAKRAAAALGYIGLASDAMPACTQIMAAPSRKILSTPPICRRSVRSSTSPMAASQPAYATSPTTPVSPRICGQNVSVTLRGSCGRRPRMRATSYSK